MIKLEKLTCTKTYVYPDNSIATPERMQSEYPSYALTTLVVTTDSDGVTCYAVDRLSTLRQIYNINENLSEEDAITAIEAILNTPVPIPEPTPEERIAAALEFQSMMML